MKASAWLLVGLAGALSSVSCTPDWATANNTPYILEIAAIEPSPVKSDVLTGGGVVNDDVTVSVNLMSRETLPAWPSGDAPPPAGPRRFTGTLDTLLEVMDLAQVDASVRHAALADVVITPRFGPSTWRDFHLADLFLAAGREAARAQLPSLQALARPQPA